MGPKTPDSGQFRGSGAGRRGWGGFPGPGLPGEFGSEGNWSQGPSELDNKELNWEGYEIDSQNSDSDGKKMLFAVLIAFPAYFFNCVCVIFFTIFLC